MNTFHYNHDFDLYAQHPELKPDDIRFEDGYVLTYELSWQFEKPNLPYLEFNQPTSLHRTNVVDVLPATLDFREIRQIELVKAEGNRLIVNIYLKEKPRLMWEGFCEKQGETN